ncbi:MAG: hypothetical protein CMK09_07390 [Ponticaulis sp.]|nr:hypothetical protein [Ponticaulis sp.]|tara:strand:+ start:5009 stop:6061 length:1053 start_codon:yes stop_codon:yes gene_type:complete
MKFAVETRIGQTRAAAFSDDDLPVSVFVWRDRRLDPSARAGDVVPAIVRKVDKGTAECFVELQSGETGFYNLSSSKAAPTEGEKLNVRIRAEVWAEKSAIVSPVRSEPHLLHAEEALKHWMSGFGVGDGYEAYDESEARDRIDEAVDDAFQETVTLTGGGCLHIEETRALTAIDIDRAGRSARSSNADLNKDSLETLARQISLRRKAGLIVVDLVGSFRKDGGRELSAHIKEALRGYGLTGVTALPPSALGLMELSIPRRLRPLTAYHWIHCPEDRRLQEAAIELLQQLETRATEDRTARFEVSLRPDLADLVQQMAFNIPAALEFEFGGRFNFIRSPEAQSLFSHRSLS